MHGAHVTSALIKTTKPLSEYASYVCTIIPGGCFGHADPQETVVSSRGRAAATTQVLRSKLAFGKPTSGPQEYTMAIAPSPTAGGTLVLFEKTE